MAISGALIGKAIGAFGRKPNIPEMPRLDPTAVQGQAIQGNQQNLGAATQLGSAVNRFNRDQFTRMLEFAAPGALGKAQEITASQMRGEIPDDVGASVMRSAAGRAFSGGFAGSGLSNNMGLRDLGLTSLQMQQQGMQNFGNLSQMFSQGSPMFDLTSMFFTPQQRLQFEFAQNQAIFQRNLLHEQVQAAPDPATAALGREVDRFFNTVAGAGMMMGGNAMSSVGGG